MSTNYEVWDDPTCDNPAHTVRLHIGKRSGGWKFAFQAYPQHDPPLLSWADWQTWLDGRAITDENGHTYTSGEFIAMVEEWRARPGHSRCHIRYLRDCGVLVDGNKDFHDEQGNDFAVGEFS